MKSFKVVGGKVMCKCGHWIGIVGSKWQHMRLEIRPDDMGVQEEVLRYREACYRCDCINPEPEKE